MSPGRFLAPLAAIALSACAALEPGFGVGVDHASRYVARGAVLFDDPAIQPSAWASAEHDDGTWTAGAWWTIDGTDLNGNDGDVTELDLYLEHERPIGPFTATFGFLRYQYPHTGFAASGEVHAALGYDCELATPTLHVWYDYDQADGWYTNLEIARDLDLDERWSLALSASAGWMSHGQGNYYFGVDSSGFSDLTTSAALSFAAGDALGLTLTLGSARVLDSDYEAASADPSVSWAILGAQLGF